MAADSLGTPPDIWLTPPSNYVKCNFVGSYNPFKQSAGIGGIIYSSAGTPLGAYTRKIMAGHSLEAVLQALIKGIEICREMGLQCIKMEGDCLILAESLKMRVGIYHGSSWSLGRSLIQSLTQVNWWNAKFCWTTVNRVADGLSKLEYPMITIFHSYLSPFIQELYLQDLQMATH